ncbi:MAG TPA: 2-oxoacid:acceptor oxidoreductase family protein [Thermoleophilia bacterium]|nr:2-oxoacid:acceptor oxidoreductase family protein [Thermoleophilia bacterium]
MLQLRIQGRGGQGAQMAGEVLATAFFQEGKYVQAYSTYGGARRGTPVSTFIRIDDDPVRERCDIEEPDAIVCFDPSLLSPALLSGATPQTVLLVNSTRGPEEFADLGDLRVATIDALAVAQGNGLGRIVNSTLLGAFARVLGAPDIEVLLEVVRQVSPRKTEENVKSARDGYDSVRMLKGGAA